MEKIISLQGAIAVARSGPRSEGCHIMIFPGFGSSESTGFAGPVAAIQQPQLAKGATP